MHQPRDFVYAPETFVALCTCSMLTSPCSCHFLMARQITMPMRRTLQQSNHSIGSELNVTCCVAYDEVIYISRDGVSVGWTESPLEKRLAVNYLTILARAACVRVRHM